MCYLRKVSDLSAMPLLSRDYSGRPNVRGVLAHGRLDFYVIHETVSPVFAGLKRLNNRVSAVGGVLPCVTIRGRIAATDMTARKADPQVEPAAADAQAVLTASRGRRRYVANLRDVGTTR